MIAAFGEFAAEYARGLGDLDAVVSDIAELERALPEAIRRRERGERFYGMVLFDHPGPKLTRLNAPVVLASIDDYDRQLLALDQLACGAATTADGTPVRTLWTLEPQAVRLMEDFYGLADAVLVRSFEEYVRLAEISPLCLRDVECVLVEPALPAVKRVLPAQPAVVVWAPRRTALEVTLHAFALREFIGEVTCVTAGGELPDGSGASFLSPRDPRVAAALAVSACIVCVEPDDPGDAVAFARRGYGVVAPLTAGAHEFAAGVVVWNGIPSDLQHRVAIALGHPAGVRAEIVTPARSPRAPAPPIALDERPLVSVVTPTYNRPHELRALLECLAAQTYANLEAIVVNDGGVAIDEIVAGFPFARLIEHPRNRGATAAVNTGLAAVRGAFVELISDDDVLYPDHIERLVFALLRSGAEIGHGAGLWRKIERGADGSLRTLGVNLSHLRGTTTPSEALVSTPLTVHQLLARQAVFAEITGIRTDAGAMADQDFLLRLALRFTFAYVDHVTSEFRDDPGSLGKTTDVRALQRKLYEELHPRPDRPEIALRRERIMLGMPEQFLQWDAP